MEEPMPMIVVERSFDPPQTDAEHDLAARKLGPCCEMRNVRWVRSYVSLDRRRGFCQFEAADAETVRQAHHAADVPYDRVWPSDVVE